ncbi:glycoside hydrolase family 81 protein [Plenodomus tracheiphilus IPT5]|uniref:glucan endo-1,3-beta-D-glucosidase n=1 Tax=Plenodomus tracheiphilus IPT5 TaxID=1408161 RepID=A0A6A7B1P2_9PLEO|nr:glycoside hydrolase family 81 protein [Plenodomus tracheiphilus IPT5]
MAKLAGLLFVASQIFVAHSLPAGEIKREPDALYGRAISISTDVVPTTSYSRAIETLQSVSVTLQPSLTGSILTELPSNGINTKDPINRPVPTTVAQPLCPNETPLDPGPTASAGQASNNIFQPIATAGPAPSIPFRNDHILQKKNIVDGNVPLQTNKFYANFFLGSQSFPVWTHPYSLAWAKGVGNSFGMAVTHTVREQFAFGPNPNSPQYFISPLGIHHLVLSAAELDQDTHLSVENLQAFSAYANLAAAPGSRVLMSFPCVQGMGFITALYDRAQPIITTGVFFRTLNYISVVNGVTHKYRLTLNDGSVWLLYATSIGSVGVPPFTLNSTSTITGPRGFKGMIQVTKNPSSWDGEAVFDSSAGAYAINATITGSVSGVAGKYSLSWGKGGVQSQTLLMYALPHHVESFDQETRAAVKSISLVTTTKGYATAVLADRITMVEDDLPVSIAFAPWAKNPNGGSGGSGNINLQPAALSLINKAGITELGQDFDAQTRLNSMYYSGKGLAKFAAIIYTMNSMTGNSQFAAAGLDRLKDAFNVFVNNTQPEPLVYDQVWKGVVSSATYRPPYDTGLDFGNTLYNDHHFHYGYFVWTAAVIGHLDPIWLEQGSNKDWVNTLVRDYANPVNDAYYPFQRSFDWFHGHSWAKGLFESGDGKDQESTSEDAFATYALKMWGKIIQDPNMEARGNLQLAVQARSLKNYFLMTSDNKNQPPQFVPNKVTGILFENKIDHTTYFGANTEYIEGIHMMPLNPSSAYTRSKQFVQEEWNTYFSSGRVDQVVGGWKAILYANLALIDPQRSYDFFADPNFNTELDGGASRTWYLAYSAAMLSAKTSSVVPDPNLTYGNGTGEDVQGQHPDPNIEVSHNTHTGEASTVFSQGVVPVQTGNPGTESQKETHLVQKPQTTQPPSTEPQYTQPQSSPSPSRGPNGKDPQPKDSIASVTQNNNDLQAAKTLQNISPSPTTVQPTHSTKGKWPVGFDWPKPSTSKPPPRPTLSVRPPATVRPTFVGPRPSRPPIPRPQPQPTATATATVVQSTPTPTPTPTYVPVQEDHNDGVRPSVYEFSAQPVASVKPVTQGQSQPWYGRENDESEFVDMEWALQDKVGQGG